MEWSWQPDPQSGISVDWVEANGMRFEVAQAGEGNRLALCLHGFPELNYSWRHQMPILAEMGYRVWAPNLRGYGASGRPEGTEAYRMNTLVQDIAGLIDASGAKEVTLIAHDWGALIAWHFAINQIRPLKHLVILNVPHPKCAQRELRKWRQLRKSWYIFFFQIPGLPEKLLARDNAQPIVEAFRGSAINKSLFTDDVLEPFRKSAQRPGAITAMLNYYRALVRRPDARDIGDGMVHVPTLVLWGEQDIAIDIHVLDGMEEYVPDLTVKRFPDASHWVQQDVPDKVNTKLKGWLEARG
ncbi:alpha/beta fold hydrolase [Altererythrobacter sp. MF3-039]|uniref:alpha/beta fold hydrolase n=1 Tax=Altererythrobacter sp. MF3-039 TaxID=3252901 RepID=UPI00390C6E4A